MNGTRFKQLCFFSFLFSFFVSYTTYFFFRFCIIFSLYFSLWNFTFLCITHRLFYSNLFVLRFSRTNTLSYYLFGRGYVPKAYDSRNEDVGSIGAERDLLLKLFRSNAIFYFVFLAFVMI